MLPRASSLEQSVQGFLNHLPAFASIREAETRCAAAAEPAAARHRPVALEEAVRLERVTFAYEGAPVLKDLDLCIWAGQVTALAGPSGAGKSTIVDLVAGLLAPDRGAVLVDGLPLEADNLLSWRRQIGLAAQDAFLFHDTVRRNLLWARPEACEDDMRAALRLAAADFVLRLPLGLDTVIGDRGVRLSGGERQRIALARALLRRPALLILDEATSNLDRENEEAILDAVDGLRGRTTVLMVSHRRTALEKADEVLFLRDGQACSGAELDDLDGAARGRGDRGGRGGRVEQMSSDYLGGLLGA